jgi:hypothetical protein
MTATNLTPSPAYLSASTLNPKKERKSPTAAVIRTSSDGKILHVDFTQSPTNSLLSIPKKSPMGDDAPIVIRNWEKCQQAAALAPWQAAASPWQKTTQEASQSPRAINNSSKCAALILSYPSGEVVKVEVYGTLIQAIETAKNLHNSQSPLQIDIVPHWALCIQATEWIRSQKTS